MEGQVEMFVEGWLYYILYGYVNRPGDLPAGVNSDGSSVY